jgi:hypothetical protein
MQNENLKLIEGHAHRSDLPPPVDEYNHVLASVVRASAKGALCAENAYLSDGYNKLFNQIATEQDVELEPHETQRVVLSLCAKLSSSRLHAQPSLAHTDSSKGEQTVVSAFASRTAPPRYTRFLEFHGGCVSLTWICGCGDYLFRSGSCSSKSMCRTSMTREAQRP